MSPFICSTFIEMSMPAAENEKACLWHVNSLAGVGASLHLHNTEVSDSCWVKIRRSPEGSQEGEALHRGEKAAQNFQKLVLSKGLILLCEAPFHVVSDRCMCEHLL